MTTDRFQQASAVEQVFKFFQFKHVTSLHLHSLFFALVFFFFSSSACPLTDTAQLYNTHPDSCTHKDRTGLEFNLSFVSLQNKNSSHCHLDVMQKSEYS